MSQRQRLEELPLFLGIEGGGTRTVAILADSADHLLKRVEAGPANLRLLGDTQLVELLRSLADALRQPRAVCIGLAGLRTEADRSRVLKAAASVWPDALRTACADLDTALAAADTLPAGHSLARVLVLSGTGSCCFGRDGGGRTAKIGGWGHLLGDKSSAYEIGLRALKAVVYYYDRDGKWPSLGAQILRALQLNAPHDLIAWTQQAEKKDIAALALEVFAAWGRRDKIAGDILTAAAANLGKDAAHCANRLAPRGALVQFIFAGSVLLKQPRFAKLVSRQLTELWPGARVTKLRSEGAWGAVRLAREAWLRESPGISGRLAGKGARSLPAGERSGDASAETGAPNSTELDTLIPEPTGPSPTEQRNPRSSHLDKMPL